ncbi:hypothetical protein [Novosphingobium sp.]|uniref:hypothetical protein n=1 Tax=Novosphingobium sp. TaxID=1874826 RepID=UPI001ED54D80|nr:hypothetical protein [Novosphingobium sp.]MBK9009436.1 hypothetical protein [Novosphingobium sp.]
MTDNPAPGRKDLVEALEAADVSAINGIASLANILLKRGLLSDAEASAMARKHEPAARAAKVCREFCCPGSSTEPRSVVRHDSNVKIAHGRSDVPLANNASMLVGNLPHLLVRRRERKMQRFKS